MTIYSRPKPECEYEQKHRRCLMCHKPFVSEWAGERVCKRCKSTSVWLEGKASYSLAAAPATAEGLDDLAGGHAAPVRSSSTASRS